jgi:TolB protein
MQRKLTRNPWVWRALVCACLLGASAGAQAQLQIRITSGVERPVPIAIVPFGWEGPSQAAPFDLAAVITADLGNSGRFAPLPASDLVSRPTQPAQINFQTWRSLETDYLLIGRLIEETPSSYTITFQLFNVLRGEQALGFRVMSAADDLRATAHRIADMIFEEITGIPGVFGTRIAYISEQRSGERREYRLIVADSDGENARVVAESPQPLMSPAWSPDSRRLAYVSFEVIRPRSTFRRYARARAVASRRAGISARVLAGRAQARAHLSLDGNLDIYTLELGTGAQRITESPAIDTGRVGGGTLSLLLPRRWSRVYASARARRRAGA